MSNPFKTLSIHEDVYTKLREYERRFDLGFSKTINRLLDIAQKEIGERTGEITVKRWVNKSGKQGLYVQGKLYGMQSLSPAALKLYGYLLSAHVDSILDPSIIKMTMGMSDLEYEKTLDILVANKLLIIKGARYYLGNTTHTAAKVCEYWESKTSTEN